MNLVYKHEKSLKVISAVISITFWVLLVVGTIGIALIYGLLFYIAFLFAHSAFISHLKGGGIRISANQHPDINERLAHCCRTIGLDEIPECYLLRTSTFNALATRFLGRNFVVLFADVIDALRDHPDALNFYIGHELGHIHRKHLRWHWVLMPASILPLLGAAYRRAQEYTCDRYGLACSKDLATANVALLAIAAGDSRYASTSAEAFATQSHTGGFWMSFHELTGDYPWLTKRVSSMSAAARDAEPQHPRRNFFAWLLALFVPRFGAGGAASMLVVVAIIGILAAIAIPAYQDYTTRAQVTLGLNAAGPFKNAVEQFAYEDQSWPGSTEELGERAPQVAEAATQHVAVEVTENGVVVVTYLTGALADHTVSLAPDVQNQEIVWTCYSDDLEPKVLPRNCRH